MRAPLFIETCLKVKHGYIYIYIHMKYAEKKSHQWICNCQVIKDAGDT